MRDRSVPRSASSAPRTRSVAVADEVRRLIQAGALLPGERLRQASIAARFGVSTTPVREALMSLASEGLVRRDAHRGVVVFRPSVEELTETYEIRQVLEPLATELAAPRITDAELDALGALVGRMRSAMPPDYAALNREFHRRIYVAAARPRLLELIEQLREVAGSYLAIAVRNYDPSYGRRAHAEHEAIRRALGSRDGACAARLMREHLVRSARHVARLLARQGHC